MLRCHRVRTRLALQHKQPKPAKESGNVKTYYLLGLLSTLHGGNSGIVHQDVDVAENIPCLLDL